MSFEAGKNQSTNHGLTNQVRIQQANQYQQYNFYIYGSTISKYVLNNDLKFWFMLIFWKTLEIYLGKIEGNKVTCIHDPMMPYPQHMIVASTMWKIVHKL